MTESLEIMEGIGSDGKSHSQRGTYRPLDQESQEFEPTPLETYVNSGELRRKWCCCCRSIPTILWTLFVVIVFVNMYITSNHIYMDDQIALGDERDIAHLFRQVKDLQANQRILMESMLRLAEQHDQERQEKISSLVREGISKTNCALNQDDALCDVLISQELLEKLGAVSAQLKSHQQAHEADIVQQ